MVAARVSFSSASAACTSDSSQPTTRANIWGVPVSVAESVSCMQQSAFIQKPCVDRPHIFNCGSFSQSPGKNLNHGYLGIKTTLSTRMIRSMLTTGYAPDTSLKPSFAQLLPKNPTRPQPAGARSRLRHSGLPTDFANPLRYHILLSTKTGKARDISDPGSISLPTPKARHIPSIALSSPALLFILAIFAGNSQHQFLPTAAGSSHHHTIYPVDNSLLECYLEVLKVKSSISSQNHTQPL